MDNINIEKYSPDIEPIEDKVHRLAKAVTSSVPVIGGALTEVLVSVVSPPQEKRTQLWLSELTNVVNFLVNTHNADLTTLSEDNRFLTAIIRSSDIVIRTSEVEVVEAIKNGLITVALKQDLDEAIVAMYLSSIAKLTSLHLRLIGYFSQLPIFDNSIPLSDQRQEFFFHDLMSFDAVFSKRHIVDRLMQDLVTEKIVDLPHKAGRSMGGPNFVNMRLTQFGEELQSFIGDKSA